MFYITLNNKRDLMAIKKCFCRDVLELHLERKQCLVHAFTYLRGCPTSAYFSTFISIQFVLIQP